MSAKDRAVRSAQQRDTRFATASMEGLRQTLASPDGRAFIWWFYAGNSEAEGEGGKGRRALARELMRAARIADFDMVQAMREEWERPQAKMEPMQEREEDTE